ncbi:MAG: carboxypeptidase regulatory-like domain-containing protein [Candidatus Hydrothermae bacterium]|nr:carboxypeptidase regulatory-like domain-containing protein [Candidatus Hydrothermae bacterium]
MRLFLALLFSLGIVRALPFHPAAGMRNTIDAFPGEKGKLSLYLLYSALTMGENPDGEGNYLSLDLINGISYDFSDNLSLCLGIPLKYDQADGVREKAPGNLELGLKFTKALGRMGYIGIYPSLYLSHKRVQDSLRVLSTGTQDLGLEFVWSIKGERGPSLSANFGFYNIFFRRGKTAATDLAHLSAGIRYPLGTLSPFLEISYDWFIFEDIYYKVDKKLYGGSPLRLNLGADLNLRGINILGGIGLYVTGRTVDGTPPESLYIFPSGNMKFEAFLGFRKDLNFTARTERKKTPKKGVLEGYIVDSATGSLISGEVTVNKRTFSAPEGYFRVEDLPVGPLEIRVSAEGYRDSTFTVKVTAGTTVTHDFKLVPEEKEGFIRGKVTSSKTGKPLAARVMLVDLQGFITATDLEGNYFLQVPSGEHRIRVESEGYLPIERNIVVAADSTLKLDFALLKPSELTLPVIYFDERSYDVKAEYSRHLKQIADLLKKYPQLKLEICGHASSREGKREYLDLLSKMRAEAVRDYLVEKLGIDSTRLSIRAYGMLRPVAPNSTPEGRKLNRRVEFRVLTREI